MQIEYSIYMADLNELNLNTLLQAIDNRDVKTLREIFETTPAIDIAELCDEIEDVSKLIFIFKTVKSEFTADFFTSLNPTIKKELIEVMSDADVAKVFKEQFSDDIADYIEELPANLVSKVLKDVSKEKREDVNTLLNFKSDTAGSIMTTEYLSLNDEMTADQAIEHIRNVGKEKETIYTLFIRDKQRNLVGTLDLDSLIFAQGEQQLKDIMNRNYVTVNVNDDQEDVAQIVKRYDLNAIAVLNADNRLCGIITIDDIVDILEEEASEDIAKMGLIAPLENSYIKTSSWQMAKKCFPWIITLLILSTFSSFILSSFQEKLAVLPILAAFIPVLTDTGGNAGGQTISLMIRGLALKEFSPKQFWKILGKELLTSLYTATIVMIFAFVWFTIEQYTGIVNINLNANIWNGKCWTAEFAKHAFSISAIVSATLWVTTIVSKAIAVMLPLAVVKMKKDPAVASEPLMTTIIDMISLLIYFGIAIPFIHYLS